MFVILTEKNLERLYKIPLSQFSSNLKIKKVNYEIPNRKLSNIFSNVERKLLISDDLARKEEWFWFGSEGSNTISFTKEEVVLDSSKEEYLYVPYSQLEYVYAGGTNKETKQ
jgi:hypothetical protein